LDTETAIETRIGPQLAEAFGQRVANSLLTLATLSYVTAKGDEKRRYGAFVESICSDDRVVSRWGERLVVRRKGEWEALLATSPR
jgi:hypothetical protein